MVGKSVLQDSIRKGPWLEEEDERLETFVTLMGERRWDSIARVSGLRRSGKSCRLRWMNYLRPNLKHGQLSAEEENIVLQLQERWGNKWSKIARKLPGRTDNEIKNYWRTYVRKKSQAAEQENSQRETNIVTSEPHSYSIEMEDISKTTSFEQQGYAKEEDILRTSEHSSIDAFGSFDGACSPYEMQLSDWMSESPNHQEEEPKYHGQCSSILDSWSPYPTWVSGDTSDSIWDYSSVSLWEMDRETKP